MIYKFIAKKFVNQLICLLHELLVIIWLFTSYLEILIRCQNQKQKKFSIMLLSIYLFNDSFCLLTIHKTSLMGCRWLIVGPWCLCNKDINKYYRRHDFSSPVLFKSFSHDKHYCIIYSGIRYQQIKLPFFYHRKKESGLSICLMTHLTSCKKKILSI
jgi:hypothetical protein